MPPAIRSTQATHYHSQTSAARQHHPPLMQFNRRAVPVLLVADLTVSVAGFFGIFRPAQVQLSEPE
ncbi:hypothetical protein LTR33_017160, partial [Friedmanniomyces endolithicus]